MTKTQRIILVFAIIFLLFELLFLFVYKPAAPANVSLKDVEGLKDCQLTVLDSGFDKLYVVRCPLSEVSVHWVTRTKNFFVHTSEGKL